MFPYRVIARNLACCAAWVLLSSLPAQATAPASQKAEDAAVHLEGAAIAAYFDKHFQIWFVDWTPTSTVNLELPENASAADAVAVLKDKLAQSPEKLSLTEVAKSGGKIFQVTPAGTKPKPMQYGADPDEIPLTEDVITQIVPLKNVAVGPLKGDLSPLISVDPTADQPHNCVIITDTSAKIHRLVEILQKLDNPRGGKTSIEYYQLTFNDAAMAAREINRHFGPTIAPQTAPQTTPQTGRANGIAQLSGRLYADYDQRTNTVVLSGPSDQVKEALESVKKMEADAKAAGQKPFEPASTSQSAPARGAR